MQNQASLQETKQHGAVRFPFNLYPCTIPGDFPQVALHWQESMELVFVKRGTGLVQGYRLKGNRTAPCCLVSCKEA